MKRREFLTAAGGALALSTARAAAADAAGPAPDISPKRPARPASTTPDRPFNAPYNGDFLSQVAFPLGGIGAGMICVEGSGALSHVSIRNHPDVMNEPCLFAAISVKGARGTVRVLEGPVPRRKISNQAESGLGGSGATYGLPRFEDAQFTGRFPFATIRLSDADFPLTAEITAWSPFEPGESDDASLPVAGLEYRLKNDSPVTIEAMFSFNAMNFLANEFPGEERASVKQGARQSDEGFVLWCGKDIERDGSNAALSVEISDPDRKTDCAWFRGGWFDPLSMAWKDVEQAAHRQAVSLSGDPSPGATITVPVMIAPGASKTIAVRLAWYCASSSLRSDETMRKPLQKPASADDAYRPWYSGKFRDIDELASYWRGKYDGLRAASRQFGDCLQGSGLPPEVIEAVAANLSILKSPTVLRQMDGRLWCWEGSADRIGSCFGSCTHVWSYAQAMPHLFPMLERSLRETEFFVSQDQSGHQTFRTPVPIRAPAHDFPAAADGQLGGIVKTYREWRISGDTRWLTRIWPRLAASLDYCIETWDPRHKGIVEEPHHNTYDIEFWGPEPMCTGFYLAALSAAIAMGRHIGRKTDRYEALLAAGKGFLEEQCFNGEYFYQQVKTKGLQAADPGTDAKSDLYPEGRALIQTEGPKYQYATGCLSDGMIGAWMAWNSGLESPLDAAKVRSHLSAVHRYNHKADLTRYACPQRPKFAMAGEGGLLLCSWPKGGQPVLPFIYSNEVWTGIEYQAASHMIASGLVDEGLEIVRSCRARYDGRVRNPFNEVECGYWYARAMSSFALLQAVTGARYDAVEQTLYLAPRVKGDFSSLLSTETGYGQVGVRNGQPFLKVLRGRIPFRKLDYTAA